MLKFLFPALTLMITANATATAQPNLELNHVTTDLTIERLYASPSLSGPTPRGVKFSPDGRRLTFLKAREDESDRFDLWQFDVTTGQPSLLVDSKLLEPEEVELSEEEKALRERKRIAGSKGIVAYDWGTADTILVPLGGDLHLVTLSVDSVSVKQLTQTDAFEYDAKVSPDGKHVSFVRDGAVYAVELETGAESQLTPLAEPDKAISYGVAEFVAQEEMSRYTGYWWSPDGRYLAYTKVDESTVDIIPRFDIQAEDVTVIEQRYPRAGRPNAIVDLFVRDMQSGAVTEILWRNYDWGPETDQYLARVNWSASEQFNMLTVQRVDRDQKNLEYPAWTIDDGSVLPFYGVMFSETQENWVNISNDFVLDFPHLTVSSEQEGYRHIVRFNVATGGSTKAVTEGDWVVDAVQYVSNIGGYLYFTGYMDTPLERHLYRYGWGEEAEPYEPVLLTERGKSWAITMAPDGQSFVGTSSAPDQPPQTALYKATDGSRIAWIEENSLDKTHPYAPYLANHTVPEYGTLEAEDGQTLHYSIQKPPGFDPAKQYPALVEVYGGPHVQTVTRNWERMSDQFYSREGYIVFRLDNRGSYNRGKRFEDAIYHRTGGPEVRDQLVGVDWLKSQPYVDANRIGLQGWSYGGYMTLMILLQAPADTFAASVAGAPVTDWSLYDTFYTERYMGTPQNNADGYEASSVFPYIDNLNSPLMLMHGMADDNVTFDNTTRLMAALQEKGKQFELMTYPGQRHGIRGQALQTHLMKTRMAFLDRHLKASTK